MALHVLLYRNAQSVLSQRIHHTGQCKRTGGCYKELVVAIFRTGAAVKGIKSIPVDFMIYL